MSSPSKRVHPIWTRLYNALVSYESDNTMHEPQQLVPGEWLESDEISATLASIQTRTRGSKTMQLDESQPPTPDGTGRPINFHTIAPGVYRSSYPDFEHYEQLTDLELKTIVTLVPGPLPWEYSNFISSSGIIHHHIPILPNKNEEVCSSPETVHQVLEIMLNPSNYPLLIHCNKGRHRTGCMVGCFRKVTGWTLEACLDEYEKYAKPKDRVLDRAFIDKFDASVLKPIALERGYVGGVYRQPMDESTKSSIYTCNTIDTYTSEESDLPSNDYQEKARKANEAALESSRLWSYR